jgi:hypothetical protein
MRASEEALSWCNVNGAVSVGLTQCAFSFPAAALGTESHHFALRMGTANPRMTAGRVIMLLYQRPTFGKSAKST